MRLAEYIKMNNYIIAYVLNDTEDKIVSFAVCDKNLEPYTQRRFESAGLAMDWADKNFKEIYMLEDE